MAKVQCLTVAPNENNSNNSDANATLAVASGDGGDDCDSRISMARQMIEAIRLESPNLGDESRMPSRLLSSSTSPVKAGQAVASVNKQCGDQTDAVTCTRPDIVKLGEYLVLGYNGSLPQGDRGRRRSKYVLFRRAMANGIVRSRTVRTKCYKSNLAVANLEQYTISYALAKNQTVVCEYEPSDKYDMFQIGRSSEAPIDFVVIDTLPGEHLMTAERSCIQQQQSTISRFACRILIQRNNLPETEPRCRIYAAGFDSSRNIYLGEKATKWQSDDTNLDRPPATPASPASETSIDGLTTNGVLLLKPDGQFCPPPGLESVATPGTWREVSVEGNLFVLRESRSGPKRGDYATHCETNELTDGSLIDLCGATLLWRSAAGLSNSPTQRQLERYLDAVNSNRPQCPVSLQTLVVPTRKTSDQVRQDRKPVVYLGCGHVQGDHNWGKMQQAGDNRRTCPICLETSTSTPLMLGSEPGFYVDCDVPDHCFSPCGHMASKLTVIYWSAVPIPCGTAGFHAACPFCAVPLTADMIIVSAEKRHRVACFVMIDYDVCIA